MKSNTPELMKFKRLQRRLGVSVPTLAGHLELLWIATAKNAPAGDIGRFSNEDIAIACYWDGDPDDFVNALVDNRWLDLDDDHRLLVHGWAEHAPRWVHGNLKRHDRSFIGGGVKSTEQATEEVTEEPTEEPTREPPPSQAKPSLTKSSQAKPHQAKPSLTIKVDWSVRWSLSNLESGFVERVVEVANRFGRAKATLDRDFIWQVSWVGCEFDRDAINDAIERLKARQVSKPKAYLNAIMRAICEAHGENWNELRTLVPPPTPPKQNVAG